MTNTFPALDIQAIQQPNPMEQLARLMEIRSQIQQQQYLQQARPLELQQQQLDVQTKQRSMQSQEALMKALAEDPHADPDDLAQKAMQYGAYPNDVLPTVNSLKESAIKTAQLRGEQLKNTQSVTDAIGQQAQMLLSIKDPDQRQLEYQSQTIPLMQQLKVPANLIPQSVPDDNWLQGHAASAMRVDQQLDHARKDQEYEQAHGLIDPGRLAQANQLFTGRWQTLHGNAPVPQQYQLSQGANWDDFNRVDKLMQQTETAAATQAQRDQTRALQNQTCRRTGRPAGTGRAHPGDGHRRGRQSGAHQFW